MNTLPSLGILSALLLATGCSKERSEAPALTSSRTTRFEPTRPDEINVLIRTFQRQKDLFHQRSTEDLGERPLAEAVWMSEADANYEQADASVGTDNMTGGTLDLILPVHPKDDGGLWVDNEDLIAKQDEFLEQLSEAAEGRRIYLVDIELKGSSESEAQLQAAWKMFMADGSRGFAAEVVAPGYVGCYKAMGPSTTDDAADVMSYKLKNWYHIYPANTYFTSVSSPIVTTFNSYVWNGAMGDPVYAGTPTTQFDGQGPGWLHSGGNSSNEICFPDYWNKHQGMRAYLGQTPPGTEIFDEVYYSSYNPPQAGPGGAAPTPEDYGSVYYPMGPYYHRWVWRYGVKMIRH